MKKRNGKRWDGKGYNKNNIIYEIKDGKGYLKDYNYNEIIFEGEYMNGLKNGNGKEYNTNGNIIFEGKYLNGKKWTGKGYDINNNIIYELVKSFLSSSNEMVLFSEN